MGKRIIASTLVIVLVILACPINTQAQFVEIAPYYAHIDSLSAGISYNGNTANCWVNVIGKTGTSKISITMSIQRLESNGDYTTLHTWPVDSANSDIHSTSKTRAVVRGEYYRTSASVTVTRNGTTETTTINSNTVKCP